MDDLEGRALALIHRLEGERDLLRREVGQLEAKRDAARLEVDSGRLLLADLQLVLNAAQTYRERWRTAAMPRGGTIEALCTAVDTFVEKWGGSGETISMGS